MTRRPRPGMDAKIAAAVTAALAKKKEAKRK
jgi:hypothetical protein